MSKSFGCSCKKKNRINYGVLERNCNYSAFESPKYAKHYSEYSQVVCIKCKQMGRTKAKYVETLKDISHAEWDKIIRVRA